MGSFKDLMVWQKAFQLCVEIYQQSRRFPADERFGLTAEVRKTARSVLYNIAEGQQRRTRREFARFLDISLGSAGELDAQLLLGDALGYFEGGIASGLRRQLDEVSRMLFALKSTLLP